MGNLYYYTNTVPPKKEGKNDTNGFDCFLLEAILCRKDAYCAKRIICAKPGSLSLAEGGAWQLFSGTWVYGV
jgi:hypothetical protein